MDRTVQDLLAKTLENLGTSGFNTVRNRLLNDWTVKSGYYTIPRAQLRGADDTDSFAELIIHNYKVDYGIELARDLLHAINEKKAGDDLYAEVKRVTGTGGQPVRPTRVPGPRPQPVGPVIDGEHFVEKHRADLISRMSPVDPVLDDLLDQKLLTDEQYDTVRSKATSQEKMRQLYDYVRSWGRPDKDKLLQALKKHNGPLIRALEQSYGR